MKNKKLKVVYLNNDESIVKCEGKDVYANEFLHLIEIDDSLDEFHKLINCSCIDIVTRCIGNKEYDFIIDDEGLFNPNNKVSIVTTRADDDSDIIENIVGNVLICKHLDENLTSVTEADYKNIMHNVAMIGDGKELKFVVVANI